MNKMYICVFSGLVMVASCMGMNKSPTSFRKSSADADYHQVMRDSHRGSYYDGIDEELVRYIYKLAVRSKRKFSSLSRGEIPELDGLALARRNDRIEKSYADMQAWLSKFFPTDGNKQKLDRYYGALYRFDYSDGPLGSLKMSISLPEKENYVCALLDKNGWLVLFQHGTQEWLHSHFYKYDHDVYKFFELSVNDAIVRVTDI